MIARINKITSLVKGRGTAEGGGGIQFKKERKQK